MEKNVAIAGEIIKSETGSVMGNAGTAMDATASLAPNPVLAEKAAAAPLNWRAHLAVHPAAERFPLMKETDPEGFKELVSDIWENGLRAKIIGWASSEGQFLLDGRNRLDALAQLGLLYETSDHHLGIKKWAHTKWTELSAGRIEGSGAWENLYEGNPYTIALSLNVHRRHLDAKGKRAAIDALLKLDPGKSDRQIAEQVGSSPTTVGKRRRKAESAGDVSNLDTRIDTKGRAQPAKKRKAVVSPVADKALPAPVTDTIDIAPDTPGPASPDTSASGEASAPDLGEQRKRENAARFDEDLADQGDRGGHGGRDRGDAKPEAPKRSLLETCWENAPEGRPRISALVLEQYFSEAGGTDIFERIPIARRDQVIAAFLAKLTVKDVIAVSGDQLRAELPANPLLKLREMDNVTAAETLREAFGAGRFETIVQKVRDLHTPKGKKPGKSEKRKFKPVSMEKTIDTSGNPVFAHVRGNRSQH
jgi:hypothetical protein